MKITNFTRCAAAFIAAAMTVSSAPAIYAADGDTIAKTGKVVYSFDFEDGDVSAFTNRGGEDTTELSVSDEYSVSGTKSMLASGRSKDWNGPAFRLDDKLEPYTEYYISAKIKGRYYTGATFSLQYTVGGETKYQNLVLNLNESNYPAENGWVTLPATKVSFNDDMEDIFVYFEGGQDDIFIDDFVVTEAPELEIEQDIPGLSQVFGNDFKVGTAIITNDLSSKPSMAIVEKHFGQSITAGNEMKPDAVLSKTACQAYFEETGDDTVPQVSFAAATPILNYCRDNNIPVRVHTLVWHSQTPDWFFKEDYDDNGDWVSSEKMLKRLENYIKAYFETLTELYPTVNFYACDVVNEALDDSGNPRRPGPQGSGGSENSAWVQVFGDNSFIEPAFTFARKYAPEGCKLYYNDFNEYMGKCDKMIEIALDLNKKGVLDGIGMQSHLDARQSLDAAFPSVSMYTKALEKFCATGLDIQITELDATTPENPTESDFKVQADYYKGIFDAIYAHKDSISAVVVWGITDEGSWRAKKAPLLFDANYMAKPAFHAIIEGHDVPDIKPTNPPVKPTDPVEPTKPSVEPAFLGDANCDGLVDVGDAVKILQALGNPDAYALSEQGNANADVIDCGSGLTGMDSLAILAIDAKLITQADLPMTEEQLSNYTK